MTTRRTLLDVCRFIIDCEHKTASTQAEGYPSIRTPNIGRGYFILDGVNRVSEETYNLWTRRAVPQCGDLIMAREAPVGNVAMIPQGLKPCLGQRTLLIRPKHCEVNPRFLAYLLLGDEVQGAIHGMTNGATVAHLNMKDVRSLSLPPLPTLATQCKIASILSAYDDLIENNTRRIAILEAMAQALYREWFVEFRFPGHEKVKFVDSPLGKIPQGWEASSLEGACKSVIDGDWIETKDQGGEAYRLLQVSNIGTGCFVETGNFRYVTQETFARLRCQEVKPGHILISRMPKPIARAWLVTAMPWRMITAVDVAIATAHPDRSTEQFLVNYLNSSEHLENAAKFATGTTRPRISRSALCSLQMVLPPLSLQKEFATVVNDRYSIITNLRRKIDVLRTTRDLLLPKLISGQLDVENLDIETSDIITTTEEVAA